MATKKTPKNPPNKPSKDSGKPTKNVATPETAPKPKVQAKANSTASTPKKNTAPAETIPSQSPHGGPSLPKPKRMPPYHTPVFTSKNTARKYYLVDLTDQVVGRAASEI